MEELSRHSGISLTYVGRILKEVGLEPMYPSIKRKLQTREKIKMIIKAFKLEMSIADIAYFIEVPVHVVKYRFKKIGERPDFIQERMKSYHLKIGAPITYRLASQIYGARDLGFNEQETSQLLDTNEAIVNYVLRNKYLEEKITKQLAIMYNVDRPYKLI